MDAIFFLNPWLGYRLLPMLLVLSVSSIIPQAEVSFTRSLALLSKCYEYTLPLSLASTNRSFKSQYLLTLVDEKIGYNWTNPVKHWSTSDTYIFESHNLILDSRNFLATLILESLP